MKKIYSFTLVFFVLFLVNSHAQCVMTGFATVGSCDPPTNTYMVTGSFYFVSPPTTGTMTILNSCGGSTTVSAPFTSPVTFTFPGLTANSASCTVMGSFSAIPTCAYTVPYSAPAACGTTGLADIGAFQDLQISPNPTNNFIDLSFGLFSGQLVKMQILDVLGKVVYEEELGKVNGNYQKHIGLGMLNKGIYFVRIQTQDHAETHKIIYF